MSRVWLGVAKSAPWLPGSPTLSQLPCTCQLYFGCPAALPSGAVSSPVTLWLSCNSSWLSCTGQLFHSSSTAVSDPIAPLLPCCCLAHQLSFQLPSSLAPHPFRAVESRMIEHLCLEGGRVLGTVHPRMPEDCKLLVFALWSRLTLP